MNPLARFEFSQSSLQDYVDCRRRFQLRYLQRVAWPAVQAEPARENEQHIQRGERFHRLVQQYLIGVPEPKLTRMAEADPDLNLLAWWRNFLDCVPESLSGERRVEAAFETHLNGFRLVAKYDLILIQPGGRVQIYDWKTSLRRPAKATLLARLQTRIYPYLLVQAGSALDGGNHERLDPNGLAMTYWFAGPDQPPEHIPYSRQRFQEDEEYLCALLTEIAALRPEEYAMNETGKSCRYCVYRSLCDRGTEAAPLSEADGDAPENSEGLDFDLEQIGEIAF